MFFASEIIKRIYFMNYKTKLTSVMLSMTTAVLLTGSAAIPLVANAALTQAQIQSILSLLSSFGADQTTINNVNSSLMGLPTSGAPTASAGACGFTRDLTMRSEEHTSELQSQSNLVCRLLLEKIIKR